jgi:hypothetical protein
MKGRKKHGLHLLHTEATFDEAVDILAKDIANKRRLASRQSKPQIRTLKQISTFAKTLANQHDVTLSDRVIKNRRPLKPKVESVRWSKQKVIDAYNSGFFKTQELARHAGVSSTQIKFWIWGDDYEPEYWWCCGKQVNVGNCPYCKTYWKDKLK